jgi:predicted nucleotidyltransferase
VIDIRPDHLEIVKAILKTHVPDAEVRAFGSRVAWTAKDHSDLDLAIMGDEPLDFRTKTLLEEAFEESDLPFRVDVVDWATVSENLRRIMEQEYVVLQESGDVSRITTEESQTNQQINSVIPRFPSQTYFWYWVFRGLADEIRSRGSGGSVVTNLSTGRFSALKVIAPPAKLRVQYHVLTTPFLVQILANDRQSCTLAALRDALLPRLLSGQVRIKNPENLLKKVM